MWTCPFRAGNSAPEFVPSRNSSPWPTTTTVLRSPTKSPSGEMARWSPVRVPWRVLKRGGRNKKTKQKRHEMIIIRESPNEVKGKSFSLDCAVILGCCCCCERKIGVRKIRGLRWHGLFYFWRTCLAPDDGRLISGSVPFCNRQESLLLSTFMAKPPVGNGAIQSITQQLVNDTKQTIFWFTFTHDRSSPLPTAFQLSLTRNKTQ